MVVERAWTPRRTSTRSPARATRRRGRCDPPPATPAGRRRSTGPGTDWPGCCATSCSATTPTVEPDRDALDRGRLATGRRPDGGSPGRAGGSRRSARPTTCAGTGLGWPRCRSTATARWMLTEPPVDGRRAPDRRQGCAGRPAAEHRGRDPAGAAGGRRGTWAVAQAAEGARVLAVAEAARTALDPGCAATGAAPGRAGRADRPAPAGPRPGAGSARRGRHPARGDDRRPPGDCGRDRPARWGWSLTTPSC